VIEKKVALQSKVQSKKNAGLSNPAF